MSNHASSAAPPGRFPLSVRAKVVLILLASLFIAMGVNSILALRDQERDTLEEIHRRGQEVAHFLSRYLAHSAMSDDYHTLKQLLQELLQDGDIVYARVDNVYGNIMATAGTPSPTVENIQQYSQEIRLDGTRLGKLYLSLSTAHVVAALEVRQHDALMHQFLAMLAAIGVEIIALSILIIRPLAIFSHVIGNNIKQDVGAMQQIPFTSKDEFGDLARGINALQDRLNEARQKLESRIDLANQEMRAAYGKLTSQTAGLHKMNRGVEQLSITDSLTGLYNRRYFEELMEREVTQSIHNDETISILLLDIDHFREFNDQYGHNAGDDVIRQVANIIAEQLRPTDVVCRYGGDEFFILCRRATIANAVSTADRLQHTLIEKPLNINGQSVRISLSIGVATIPGVHRIATTEEFFQCAAAALHTAKQQGLNGVAHFSMRDRGIKAGTL